MVSEKHIQYIVVDTTAFIQNAPLHEFGTNIVTIQEVVDEIKNKRQLKNLVVLPYDLTIKAVFSENIKTVSDFAKKTGDYTSLSATDIKVIALTYQLEKEHVGVEHINKEPKMRRQVNYSSSKPKGPIVEMKSDTAGFYSPGNSAANKCDQLKVDIKDIEQDTEDTQKHALDLDAVLYDRFQQLVCTTDEIECDQKQIDDVLQRLQDDGNSHSNPEEDDAVDYEDSGSDDDESGWITPSNIKMVKKQMNSPFSEEKDVTVACVTTDFAMQNVLKQMNLNVSALDGRVIKQLRTFILRCYACFHVTSVTTKRFCPKCGNDTLKKVAVTVDEDGKQRIHINARRPLTARGKKYSLPTFKGGKHSNNPIVVEDQPRPHQKPTRLARMKNNPMDDDYTAGYSPFVMRDVNSKSAQLCVRPGKEVKHWMRQNPNEGRRKRK